MNRTAGTLLSVSSLPSKYGIGCFNNSAYAFVDRLRRVFLQKQNVMLFILEIVIRILIMKDCTKALQASSKSI